MTRRLSMIPSAAVFDRRLGHADIRVLCALRAFADRIEGVCWKLFPDGRIEGNWFRAEGWQGDPLRTVRVNLKTSRWRVTERRWVSPEPGAA